MTIILFIVILAVLVLVHEFGHFIVAKKSGMKVDEFGFGFPPRLFGVRRGETLYSFNLLPLGGFVKIVGENNSDADDPRSFVHKSFKARFGTLVAGVTMNVLLAIVLMSIGFGIGLPAAVAPGETLPAHATLKSESVSILQVEPNSPAKNAGLKEGDAILSLDGHTFTDADGVSSYIHSREGSVVNFHVKRGSEELDLKAEARKDHPADQGAVGIAIGNVGMLSYPWWYTPVAGVKATWQIIETTVVGFYQLIKGGIGFDQLGGPVKIASLTGQVAKLGFVYVLQFAAFLSVNLAILNILPFPALDGGRVLFLLIEKIRGKKNNAAIENWANTIGFALLILLIAVITFHDIRGLGK